VAKNPLPPANKGSRQRPLLVGGKGFFTDCLYWQVAKDSLPTVFIGRWQRCRGS